MSRGSAFARVIGITRSLTPLSFDRSRKDGAEEFGDAPDDLPAGAADDSPALPKAATGAAAEVTEAVDETGDVFHAVELAIEEESAKVTAANVMPFPVQSKVTVVGDGPSAVAAIVELPPAPVEETPAEIPGEMIEAIENDMASLLASLNRLDDAPPMEAQADSDDDEEPTLALLSELNRMWQADPDVVGGRP